MQEKKDNRIGGDMELGHVVMVLTTSMLGRCWAGIQWAAGKAEVVSCVSRLFFDGRRAVPFSLKTLNGVSMTSAFRVARS